MTQLMWINAVLPRVSILRPWLARKASGGRDDEGGGGPCVPRALTIKEVPIPAPGPGEVLVKVMPSGVCRTDLHTADGDWPAKPTPPFTPGHEGAGVVAAVGPGVKRLQKGDSVGVAWLHDACGEGEHCITGWETLCESQHNSGYSIADYFAEYVIDLAGLPSDIGGLGHVGVSTPKPWGCMSRHLTSQRTS
jgi:hypothetical protein